MDIRQRCERCKERLNDDRIVWLDLNRITGQFSDSDWPDDESQGAFPFGAACAKRVLAEQKKGA